MGKSQRDKGAREERAVVATWQQEGFTATRVPLSGALGGRYDGDVLLPICGDDRKVECKVRANGFKSIYDWLGTNWALTIRADRRERLFVIRETDLMRLAMAAERASIGDG